MYSVKKWPNRTKNNIFMALDKHHTCTFIVLQLLVIPLIFSSLQFDNKYISNISSIFVYQQLPLNLALYWDRSGPSCGVRLFEESKRRLSGPHRHHAKGMRSLHQKTHRSHVNTVWSLFQTWLFGTIYIAHIVSFL